MLYHFLFGCIMCRRVKIHAFDLCDNAKYNYKRYKVDSLSLSNC